MKIPHDSNACPLSPIVGKKLLLKSGIGRSASLAPERKGKANKAMIAKDLFISY
jgi:hypothetical protein